MAMYVSRRKLRPKEPEETGELNVVPYLDILMNLIIFMLLSMTGLAVFGIVNVTAPAYGGDSGATEDAGTPLNLVVGISTKGFYVSASHGVAAPKGDDTQAQPTKPTVPVKADGSYDF